MAAFSYSLRIRDSATKAGAEVGGGALPDVVAVAAGQGRLDRTVAMSLRRCAGIADVH